LGNAQHLKRLPGRRTHIGDGQSIAELLHTNTKLTAVAANILGVSGQAMLNCLIEGANKTS